MKRIGILSDTHGFTDTKLLKHFDDCSEIWHAGDVGNIKVIHKLQLIADVKAVYGNVDGQDVRAFYPEVNSFDCEEQKVLIKHIVGYPKKYYPGVKQLLLAHKPGILIAGHSHILKIMHDPEYNVLFINPGAAGKQGMHRKRTLVKVTIDGKDISDCEVVEIDR